MKEMIISFETSKVAKEKGFKEPTLFYYFEDEELRENKIEDTYGYYGGEYTVEYEELLKNWNDGFVTKKDGNRCFGCNKSKDYFETFSAPTLSLLQTWLRRIHNIDITIMLVGYSEYEYYIHQDRKLKKNNNVTPETPKNLKFLYEYTLEVALQEALKIIK